jgi:hypothetical protein
MTEIAQQNSRKDYQNFCLALDVHVCPALSSFAGLEIDAKSTPSPPLVEKKEALSVKSAPATKWLQPIPLRLERQAPLNLFQGGTKWLPVKWS